MKKFLVTTFALAIAIMANAGQSFAKCGCGCEMSKAVPCAEYAWAIPSNYQKAPCIHQSVMPQSRSYAAPCCKDPCPAPCVTGCAAPCPCDPCCDPCKCEKKRSWIYNLFHRNNDCGCKPKCNSCCD